MSDIFISYSHKDTAKAEALFTLLSESHGLDVWMDPRLDTEGVGKPFSQEIKAALDEARRVIVLWSHNSKQSVWVEDEAARATDQHKYLPLLIDDLPARELPMPFSRYHMLMSLLKQISRSCLLMPHLPCGRWGDWVQACPPLKKAST
ncbi:MAG: toll/interleukin-1 receptor domain-containing protein [Hyphomicrobiaceae bacterium]|nr:toll/interleukin-1 receptor domain-containing protein [Hyphomicrobiaceae bacterium]